MNFLWITCSSSKLVNECILETKTISLNKLYSTLTLKTANWPPPQGIETTRLNKLHLQVQLITKMLITHKVTRSLLYDRRWVSLQSYSNQVFLQRDNDRAQTVLVFPIQSIHQQSYGQNTPICCNLAIDLAPVQKIIIVSMVLSSYSATH